MKPPSGHRPPNALLYGAIVAMVLFWSLNYIVGKFALRDFPPALLAGLRVTFAAVMVVPVYAWRHMRPDPLPGSSAPRPGPAAFVLLALAGVALNQLFFLLGLSLTSVAHTAILIGLTPVIVLLIAAVRGMEKLTPMKITGMAIALAGVAVLASPAKGAHATLLGDALVFFGAFCFAVFTIAGKRATCCYDSVTVTTIAYIGGAAFLLPVTVWGSLGFDYSGVTVAGWLGVLYMAAFPSVVCYLIYYWALMHIPASRVSSFSYLQPLIATVLAVPLLGEPVTRTLALGGALVLGGVFLTERVR